MCKMSPRSNNAVIYRKLQHYGPIEGDGDLAIRGVLTIYMISHPGDGDIIGDIIAPRIYSSLDIFLVS